MHDEDETVGRLEGNGRSVCLIPVGMQVSSIAIAVLLGDLDELITVRGPSILAISLTLQEVIILEGKQVVDLVLDDSSVAAVDAVDLLPVYPLQQSTLGTFLDLLE